MMSICLPVRVCLSFLEDVLGVLQLFLKKYFIILLFLLEITMHFFHEFYCPE